MNPHWAKLADSVKSKFSWINCDASDLDPGSIHLVDGDYVIFVNIRSKHFSEPMFYVEQGVFGDDELIFPSIPHAVFMRYSDMELYVMSYFFQRAAALGKECSMYHNSTIQNEARSNT